MMVGSPERGFGCLPPRRMLCGGGGVFADEDGTMSEPATLVGSADESAGATATGATSELSMGAADAATTAV